ncbi:MAG: hypothetical protein Q8Q13_00740, partial [bacterium]|nr:hypothetical protein [bacterium]
MIKTVLLWIFWLFIITLVVYWIWAGGFGRAVSAFRSAGNPFSTDGTSGGGFHLPWQPTVGIFAPAPASSGNGSAENAETSNPQDQYSAFENNYNQLNSQANQAKVFGDPSPERGRVRITDANGAVETDVQREYVVITANGDNSAPVELKGWSLQSAYTGVRAYIPLSTSAFVMGIMNDQENVLLNPGASAIVNSGSSPVATSFRENICSGYLEQLQRFYPSLSNSCPPASDALPFTPENLKVYGEQCFNFLESVPPCTAPL